MKQLRESHRSTWKQETATTTTTLPTTNDGGDEDGGDEIDDDEGHNSQVQRCFSRAQKFPVMLSSRLGRQTSADIQTSADV